MSEREKLAERLWREAEVRRNHPDDYDPDITQLMFDCVAALRSPDLPSEEEIARAICRGGGCQVAKPDGWNSGCNLGCTVGRTENLFLSTRAVLSLLRTRSPSDEGWRTMRIYELVDVINAGERLGARINGRFVLDRDKVLAFLAQKTTKGRTDG